jgi:hypothetical protein
VAADSWDRAARSAVFDATGRYRYQLWRRWDARRPSVAFVLLNPSRADAVRDDPTIRRCVAFAQRWGFGSLFVVNLFALRATKPKDLFADPDPVGPENDRHLAAVARRARAVVVAWGNHGSRLGRDARALACLPPRRPLLCLGVTRQRAPRHPLYLRKGTVPRIFAR